MLVFALTLAVSGCAAWRGAPEQASYWRGQVKRIGSSYLFQTCQAKDWQTFDAVPSILVDEYERQRGAMPGAPLYLEGWSTEQGERRVLFEPRVIGGGLEACEETYPGTELRIVPLQPGWQVDLNADELRYASISARQTLVFSQVRRMREGSLWRWLGELEDRRGGRYKLTLEVMPMPCHDAQGRWYKLSAEVIVDGVSSSGCARYGKLTRFSAARRYRTEPGMYLRELALSLEPDGRAQLDDDYQNGQPVIVRQGHWRLLTDGRLMLTLANAQGSGEEPLLWQRDGRVLRLETADPLYGRGLELVVDQALEWAADYRRRLP